MQIPDEIKRGLEMCAETCFVCPAECPYMMTECSQGDKVMADALAYIQQLEQDNAQKDERIRQLEREREAMLRDMKAWPACDACKHRNLLCTQKPCSECREAGNGKTVMWEWRGVEEDET